MTRWSRYLALPAVAATAALGLFAAVLLVSGGVAHAQAPAAANSAASARAPGYSPYAARSYPTRVYWGDEHIHTSWSADAGGSGATVDPEGALRFARGEEVVSTTGQRVRLSRPLDWVAVTDHSDGMGVISEILGANPEMMADPQLKSWHDMMKGGPETAKQAVLQMIAAQSNKKLPPLVMDPRFAKAVWAKSTAIMDKYNEPGRFTAFIAYEWTSNAGGGDNLHRNVIYRDGKNRADQALPMTTFQSENPERLWDWMANWEKTTGGSLLAIPHNGNLSNGRMFELTTFEGKPLTREWAEMRARFEPLVETAQYKGQSEAHPLLSTTDEFVVGYELWDQGNLGYQKPKTPGMLQYEYTREALKNGLAVERQVGVNPFKYGIAAGTDTHNGLSATEEDNSFGKFPQGEPSPGRWSHISMQTDDRVLKGWEYSAAGWTGVWATANTREALWDAMKRKEVYGTSGTRMTVRFFGGWDFASADARSRTPAEVGYAKGVPMGGELRAAAPGRAPTFLIGALKDPIGANLDRIQVVKGWVDKAGKTHERIHNVAWGNANRRKPDAKGKLPPVGNTVDLSTATWSNTIGDPELATVWKDPDFDPAMAAVYYVRVLEIPTPRWTAYDVVRFRIKMDPKVPMVTQERAWTSPIWYSPK